MLYLPEDSPRSPENVLNKILEDNEESEQEEE